MAEFTITKQSNFTLGEISNAFDFAYFVYDGRPYLMPYMGNIPVSPPDDEHLVINLDSDCAEWLPYETLITLANARITLEETAE